MNEKEEEKLITQVRLWADLNTNALLESDCNRFEIPSVDGFIGYKIGFGCAIVFGEPVCESSDKPILAQAFKADCEKKNLNVIYIMVSKAFAELSMNRFCSISMRYGDRLVFNPSVDLLTKHGPKGGLVRKKVKHAIHDGVHVSEYSSSDPKTEEEIAEMAKKWLEKRHGPQVYISHLTIFKYQKGKRLFLAKREESVVGMLVLHEIKASKGFLLNNLITAKNAPHGTSELLITSTIKTLEGEKCSNVIVGPAVANNLEEFSGLGSFSSRLASLIFRLAKMIFGLNQQTIFWEKFQPEVEPSYLLFDRLNVQSLRGLMYALNVIN